MIKKIFDRTMPDHGKKIFYFDHAAAMPPDQQVLDFYCRSLKEDYFNHEAAHSGASDLRERLDDAAKELIQSFYGSNSGNIKVIWSNSATDIFELLANSPLLKDSTAALSRLEHPALDCAIQRGAKKIISFGNDHQGVFNHSEAAKALSEADIFVTHSVQSELGVIQNNLPLFDLCRENKCISICDAVQAAGKLPFLRGADLNVISGIKFGAPGAAALLIDNTRHDFSNLISFAEKYRKEFHRSGRVSFASATALAMAAKIRCARAADDLQKISSLNMKIRNAIKNYGLLATVDADKASPYILHITLPEGIQGAVIVRMLSQYGIYAASGSACAAESDKPSSAMLAIGRNRRSAYYSLRISFGFDTDGDSVNFLLNTIEKVLKNF
jgi:cysteine desulfurase